MRKKMKKKLSLYSLILTLHLSFNSAQDCQTDPQLLEEISYKEVMMWNLFSKKEFISLVKKCNNLSTSGLDKLSWRHLKIIVKDNACFNKFIDIANVYINLEYWPSHFKILTIIVILKPNKESYDFFKAYQPIVLLNTISKLIEKVIGKRMQFTMILNNFIHLY